MPNNTESCKILIVDNDLDCAKKIAYELEQIRPDLIENQSLEIEISNTAYFVANQIERFSGKSTPWDVILSDVYMPIPSRPLQREIADETAKAEEIRYENYKWKFWNYNYTWNSHIEDTIDDGGLFIANKVKLLKDRNKDLDNLKVVLISNRLVDPNAREKVIEYLLSEKSWFNFYDKTNWEEDTEDWPKHLNDPNIFKWAVIHAINERNSEIWGDSLDTDDETFLAVSKAMKQVITKCKTIAKDPTLDTILITGERGIGKSMLARALHKNRMNTISGKGKFVTVECTSVSDELFFSQLFGHVKGAFTGADSDKVGFVETAKDGTLFFDEIGDLSRTKQGAMLRLLQDKQFVKVGSNEDLHMKAKLVIFATNKSLEKMMNDGSFRTDLYDRMTSAEITIPPLKERKDEIIPLAKLFLKKTKRDLTISEDAKQFLIEQPWEGNIRQLKKTIIQAATFCTSTTLRKTDIRRCLSQNQKKVDTAILPHDDKKPDICINAENIVTGKIKWTRIKNEPYDFYSAIMIVAKSLWKKPQKELAEILDVKPNTLEQFYSTLKRNVKKGKLELRNLKPHVAEEHYPVLDQFFSEFCNFQNH